MMTRSVYDHIIPYFKDKRPHLYTENMQPEHGCGKSLQFPILTHNLLLIWNMSQTSKKYDTTEFLLNYIYSVYSIKYKFSF